MVWSLVVQTLSFRAAVIGIDYVILAVALQRPVEAGVISIVRHVLHTFMYWGHEVVWARRHLGSQRGNAAASRRQSVIKAFSFRVISLAADVALLLVLTGDVRTSGAVALAIGVTNTIFFYYHDRWWTAWRAHHLKKR